MLHVRFSGVHTDMSKTFTIKRPFKNKGVDSTTFFTPLKYLTPPNAANVSLQAKKFCNRYLKYDQVVVSADA